MLETTSAKFEPRWSESSSAATASWTPSAPGPGQRRVDLLDLRRAVCRLGSSAPLGAAAGEGPGHHDEGHQRRGGDAERDRELAMRDPQRDGDHEAHARQRLHQHEASVEGEVLVSRQPAAREVAGGVGDCSDDEHVVEAAEMVEDMVDELFAQRQRDRQEDERETDLDGDRDAQGMVGLPPRPPLGDRAREELFDRPVDHRDRHEHDRPQKVDALRFDGVQHVARQSEVGERQQAGGGDADRQDPRAAAV